MSRRKTKRNLIPIKKTALVIKILRILIITHLIRARCIRIRSTV